MIFGPDGQYRVQGWVVSALFHSLALSAAVGLVAQIKPIQPREVFQWEVALVEPQRAQEVPHADEKPHTEPAKPTSRPAAPAPSRPQTVTHAVQTREVTPVVQRELRQVVETSQPIQQTVEAQTRTELVSQVQERRPTEVQQAATVERQAERAVVESSSSVVAQAVQTAAVHPVLSKPAVSASHETPSVVHREPVVSAPPAAPAAPLEPPAAPSPPAPASVAAPPHHADAAPPAPVHDQAAAKDSTVNNEMPPIQEATLRDAPVRTSATKADFGWLAKSLWDRVAMLKRYPHRARVNHMEGRVLLRVVIKEDGHIKDLQVAESSGHSVLDQDALEIVRRAVPLKLTQPLGRPHVVVLVPISYRLEQ